MGNGGRVGALASSVVASFKRFRRGIEQVEAEGLVQVLRSEQRGDEALVLAAVGPMQFEVATHRLEAAFGVRVQLDHLPYELAAHTDPDGREILRTEANVEVMTRVRDDALLAVFPHRWRMRTIAGRHPTYDSTRDCRSAAGPVTRGRPPVGQIYGNETR
jgi:peptide chain release factor 3